MEKLTKEILYRMGITSRYKGYWYISYAMVILIQDEDCLLKLAASLYTKIAQHYNVSVHNVEYDIRTAVLIAWETNQGLLEKLSRTKLYKPPTNKEFLEDLLSFIKTDK